MINAHTSVAIAQVVFYAPMLPTAIFVLSRNWPNRPRMPWYPLVTFSLIRFGGGIVTIVRESKPSNIGLIIATTILLNVGVIPLLISLIGLIRLILKSSLDSNPRTHVFLKVIRIAFAAAIGLLVAGGSLSSNVKDAALARALSQAGYVVLAVVLVLATVQLGHLYTQKNRISSEGLFYTKFCLAAVPALALRAAYGLLYEFTITNSNSIWNPLIGSPVAFVLICLLPEFMALLVFISLGFHHMKHSSHLVEKIPTGEEAA